MDLTQEQIARYGRHLILPEIGLKNQVRLLESKVLLIGTGGLGSPLGLYLAAAGVGTLGLVDFDLVELSNLQRQVIHGTEEVGKPKLESAERRINSINPDVNVIKYPVRLTSENALDVLKDFDIVIDGTDNFPTRYLVNDACVMLGKPNVYGSIYRFDGQATVFNYNSGPCYRCLYPEPPPPGMVPSCADGGVIGILPGIIGLIQAMEAVKIITGQGETLSGKLLLFDALKMKFRELTLRRDKNCSVCGDSPTVTELIDYEFFCGLHQPPSKETVRDDIEHISAPELKSMFDNGNDFILLDVREPHEYELAHIEGSKLLPLGLLKDQAEVELGKFKNKQMVVHCRSGVRSIQAIDILRELGFNRLKNLENGILGWSEKVDPNVPAY